MPPFQPIDYQQARDEENIPTRCTETQTHPRLSCPHEHPRWSGRYTCSPCQGPYQAQRLNTLTEAQRGLPKTCRVLHSTDYSTVLRSGKKTNDPLFSVTTAPNTLQQTRLGITVSRKVSKKAVVRNRIKRQVRESFRHNRPGLGSVDMIVIARQPAASSTNPEIRAALQKHWDKIRQQCGRS